MPDLAPDGPILLTGATGGLGRCFLRGWAGRPIVPVARQSVPGHGRQLDLSDAGAVDRLMAEVQPAVVVHCAALADVDRCEDDRDAAIRDNVTATRSLVTALRAHAPDCRLVAISTDQVYRGPGPGRPGMEGPVNLYGLTKLWGEDVALQHPGTLILRLNYVGQGTPERPGLASWLTGSLGAGRPITVFEDVLFNPCHGSVVPAVVADLLAGGHAGVFNLGASGGGMSKADFLLGLADRLGLPTATARRGRLADAALRAPRPLDMRMDVSATERALGRALPDGAATLDTLAEEWRRAEEAM